MKSIASIVTAVMLAATSAVAQGQEKPVTVTGADELVRESSRSWEGVWIRPDADLSRYDKLYLWQSVFQFRDVGDQTQNRTTTAMLRGDQGTFSVSEESRAKFEEIVTDVVLKELGRSKQFQVVDTIGPRTLAVRGLVLDIVSFVPDNIGRQGNVHLTSMGEATFVFELIDAETGVIQARVGDRRPIRPPSRMNQLNPAPTTEATVWNDVRRWAQDQAMTLRRELDKAAKKAKK